jgi:hypothetical protein
LTHQDSSFDTGTASFRLRRLKALATYTLGEMIT